MKTKNSDMTILNKDLLRSFDLINRDLTHNNEFVELKDAKEINNAAANVIASLKLQLVNSLTSDNQPCIDFFGERGNKNVTNKEEKILKELIAIQAELKAPKGQFNSFGKYSYRSCEDILEAVKPLLTKYNATILLTDEVKSVGEHIYIEATAIFQVKDTSISVRAQAGINPNRKGMDVAQSYGASSSYARKYVLAGLLLLDDNKDADTKDNSEENRHTDTKKLDILIANINKADSIEELIEANIAAYKFANGDESIQRIVLEAKDARKKEIGV